MGFNPFHRTKIPDVLSKQTIWQSTNVGRTKIESYEGSDHPKFTILAVLVEEGPSTIEELGQRTKLGKDAVHHHLKGMRKAGYVQVLQGEKG